MPLIWFKKHISQLWNLCWNMKHKVIRTFGITAVNFSHFDDVIQVILHFISGENVPDDDNFFVRNTKICAYILFRMYPVWDTSQLGCIPFRGFLNRALCSGFLQRVIFLLVYVFLILPRIHNKREDCDTLTKNEKHCVPPRKNISDRG